MTFLLFSVLNAVNMYGLRGGYGGANIKTVQQRLGHADIVTTNKYLHAVQEADEQAANIL